jgi:Protein of unknown function (DUF4238)
MKPINEPVKHHFLPQFYLNRWANSRHSGEFFRYSKPYNDVLKGKWVSAGQTGYQDYLYTFADGQTGKSINLELDLLKSVDDVAAKILANFENGKTPISGTPERIGWARFLICQQMRLPEDIKQLRSMASEQWKNTIPSLQASYDQWRNGQGQENISEFLQANFPQQDSELAADMAKRLLIHDGITNLISSMRWRIIEFTEDCHPLLTSDRPVWVSATLKEKDDFLWMPIGPRKLFVAAVDDAVLNILCARPKRQLAKSTNEIIVKTAFQSVYAIDDSVTQFVEKRFAIAPHSRLLELVARHRGLTIRNKRSPSYENI